MTVRFGLLSVVFTTLRLEVLPWEVEICTAGANCVAPLEVLLGTSAVAVGLAVGLGKECSS